MARSKAKAKDIPPLFGVDTEEIELLRQLEKEVRDFLEEDSRMTVVGFGEVLYNLDKHRKQKRRN